MGRFAFMMAHLILTQTVISDKSVAPEYEILNLSCERSSPRMSGSRRNTRKASVKKIFNAKRIKILDNILVLESANSNC